MIRNFYGGLIAAFVNESTERPWKKGRQWHRRMITRNALGYSGFGWT